MQASWTQPEISDDPIAAMRRELEAALPPYRTIVVGTDGSPTAQEAVRHAVAISRALGARLHVVCAAPQAGDVATMLDRVAQDARRFGVDVACHPAIGVRPVEAILDVATRTNAELIVVGNRGMTGTAYVVGSVPEAVAHRASCSVAIIKTT